MTSRTDRPLSFVDHHLRVGDALLGVLDPKVLENGIPDEAYTALSGDDKEVAKALKKQNKADLKSWRQIAAGDLLTQAGVTGVSAGGLVGASALLGALVLVTVTAVVGVPAVGLCFGLLAGGGLGLRLRRAGRRGLRDGLRLGRRRCWRGRSGWLRRRP